MQVPNIRALEALEPAEIAKTAAVVIEPLIQGAAGMRLWPPGTLRAVREWCNRTDTLLIVNEVMTGFGRTGRMFASEHEAVIPDMMVMAKGLSGGYLPLAITLITEKLFSTFDGSVVEGKALGLRAQLHGKCACLRGMPRQVWRSSRTNAFWKLWSRKSGT